MKYGLMGTLFKVLCEKPVYEYTAKALPELDMKVFKRAHLKEYREMSAVISTW